MRLSTKIKDFLFILLMTLMPLIHLFGQDTYEDDFNGGFDYTNSSGNQTWTTSWVESGETTNPNTGRIRINSNQLRFRNLDTRSISRGIDLSSYSGLPVILTLDFNRTNGNETINVDLLNNVGVWETIATTGGTGSISHTLTATQIHAASAIRFISGSGDWNNNSETVFIDNVQFEANEFIITDGITVNTCNDIFLDSGGTGGDYSNNEGITYTICPDSPGASVSVNFTTFDVETNFDALEIFDSNTTSNSLGTFDNSNIPGTITSTDSSGCLTFIFSSDVSVTGNWAATISCINNTPEISINDVTVNENTGTLDFTVAHTGGTTTGSFTVEYATANNTAIAPGDYTATGSPNPTITFTGTSLSNQIISIPIINDNVAETLETFFVNLSNPSDGSVTITDAQGIGTINASDPASIAINDVSVNESAGTATFTVTASGGAVTGGYTVNYSTADNSATTATNDYTSTSSPPSLNFVGTIGETQTITVPILEDVAIEGNETYFVNLSSVSSSLVSMIDNQGLGTIIDNDAGISINDITVNENVGNATFTVTLTGTVSGGFTVDYDTANNTATIPSDYTGTGSPSPSLTFAGNDGETQTITIPIINDNFVETASENFFINLSNVSSGLVTITDSQGIGTINDNDTASIAINDISVNETAGTATFTVTHSGGGDISGGFTVEYATANSSATSPSDYMGTGSPNPTLSFSGTNGETQTIVIPIIDDTDIEGTETYFINLSNISNSLVGIVDSQGLGTIIDDDAPFIITNLITDNTCSGIFVDSGSVSGSYSDNESITYTICPDTPSSLLVLDFTSFDVETFWDGLSIFQGTTTTTLIGTFDNSNIPTTIISGDPSGCLTFIFTSDNSITGTGWQANISCTNTGASLVSINDITVNENAGTATFTATHTGGNVSGGFTVNYSTEDNTAYADSDFITSAGILNFSGTSGQSLTITVPIINNAFGENTETFFVNLSNPSTTIGLVNGLGTILDDGDPAVTDDVPLTLFDEFNGYYDYALTAGSLRTADEGIDPCAITTSSSNTLTTPITAGSTIEKAYLLWGHSASAADDVVTFEGQTVTADIVNSANGGFHYGMVSDVTAIIQAIPDPSTNVYDFTDLVVDNSDTLTNYCSGTVVFGGWSLFIFYTNPTFPAVSINMYNGFDAEINSTTNYTLSGFFAIGSSGSKTSVLSWEGDPQRTGNETISVTTTSGTTILAGDGNNSTTLANVFNSTIYDNTASPIVNDSSLFGFDLDTYDISSLITQGETSATTNIQTGGDFVILNSVLLKVPSNLMTGTVFEDVNYPGGAGRSQASSSGIGIEGARVELYDNLGVLEDFDITDANGNYNIGGMANGTYSLRVVSNTVNSNRGGGTTCINCLPVQTFRSSFASSTLTNVSNEIGGADPSAQDVAANVLIGAQTVSSMTILNEGAVDVDFGFNFNTIVNTNASGQGSLEQFIINANNLDETGLNIEANSIFNPAGGEDTSIFMIPPTSDPLGRTADGNFTSGYFNININSGSNLSPITADNTHIDGRTQTAYSGDTNTGNITPSVTNVGVSATALPSYQLPEIQIDDSTLGDVFTVQANGVTIRNTAILANGNIGIQNTSGSNPNPVILTENLIGINADGVLGTRLSRAIRVSGAAVTQISNNYISENASTGISVNGGTSTLMQYNTIESNGTNTCADGIELGSGTGVTIQYNLINNTAAIGIEGFNYPGGATINENTITNSGQNGGLCSGVIENSGIRLYGNNSSITSNIIANNGGAGIVITGGTTSGNLISQNSTYANGTTSQALGIDIDQTIGGNPVGDGVTQNDNGDTDTGPNGSLNFPEFESATISGTTLRVVGWARPGAIIEFFITDINEGTATVGDNQLGLTQDYGEGQIYLGSATEGSGSDLDATTSSYTDADGNTDTTNRFSFNITLSTAIPIGSLITATATVANSTSEFGNTFPLSAAAIITNRRITFRVVPN